MCIVPTSVAFDSDEHGALINDSRAHFPFKELLKQTLTFWVGHRHRLRFRPGGCVRRRRRLIEIIPEPNLC
jgi:hypothetical protein